MHAVLKRETAQLHRRLNTLPNARVLVTSRLRLPEYGSILLAFARAYSRVEGDIVSLEQRIDVNLSNRYTRRLPAITRDIAALHRDSPHDDAAKVPSCINECAPDLPQYLGLRYVIEGSTQGGAFIARRLRQNLPELAANAFAFWTVQETAAACWPWLCETIDEVGVSQEHTEYMLASARGAFQLFIDSFSNTG